MNSKASMILINLTAVVCLAITGFAQEVQFDYDRSANFNAYKTYEWVEKPIQVDDQLLDKDIRRAVDAELAGKGLRRVDSNGDLRIGYQIAISNEKQLDGLPAGPPWLGTFGSTRVTSSTIEIGKLVVLFFDPATTQLVWRGSASKTLDINENPDKNYRNLEKAMARLFKNYPPVRGKR